MTQWLPGTLSNKSAYESAYIFWPDAFEVQHHDNTQGVCMASTCTSPALPGQQYCSIHITRIHAQNAREERQRTIAQRTHEHARVALPPPTFRPPRPVHPRLQYIVDFMNDIRFYGREDLQDVLALITQENHAINEDILARRIDPFDVPRLNADLEEIERRAHGKLMATRLRMAERDAQGHTHSQSRPQALTASELMRMSGRRV